MAERYFKTGYFPRSSYFIFNYVAFIHLLYFCLILQNSYNTPFDTTLIGMFSFLCSYIIIEEGYIVDLYKKNMFFYRTFSCTQIGACGLQLYRFGEARCMLFFSDTFLIGSSRYFCLDLFAIEVVSNS